MITQEVQMSINFPYRQGLIFIRIARETGLGRTVWYIGYRVPGMSGSGYRVCGKFGILSPRPLRLKNGLGEFCRASLRPTG